MLYRTAIRLIEVVKFVSLFRSVGFMRATDSPTLAHQSANISVRKIGFFLKSFERLETV